MPVFSWLFATETTEEDKFSLIKDLITEAKSPVLEGLEISRDDNLLVLNQAIALNAIKSSPNEVNTIPVFKDNFSHRSEEASTKVKERFSFLKLRKKPKKESTQRRMSSATMRSQASSFCSEYSYNVKSKKQRFRKLADWRKVFSSKNSSEEHDTLENWMAKRFVKLAKNKIQRKLSIALLERASMGLSLVEEQVIKERDEKLALFVNSLNGYVCCLRFGYARKAHHHSSTASQVAQSLSEESTSTSAPSFFQSVVSRMKLNKKEMEKRHQVLSKVYTKKGKDGIKLQQLQYEAVCGIYESFILFLLDFKTSQKVELCSATLSDYITDSILNKLKTTIQDNKDKVLTMLKTFADINKAAFNPTIFSSLFNSTISSFLESNLDNIIGLINSLMCSTVEIVKTQHLSPFLETLEANGIFKQKWKVHTHSRQLIFDEHDKEMIKVLQTTLEKMYIQVEFIIQCMTIILLENVQKLIS